MVLPFYSTYVYRHDAGSDRNGPGSFASSLLRARDLADAYFNWIALLGKARADLPLPQNLRELVMRSVGASEGPV